MWSHLLAVRFAVHVGAIRREDGVGTANTSLLYHAGRLMAMHDADMPYELRLGPYGAISTAGRLDADRLMSRLREGSSCSSSSSNSSATSSGSDNSDGGSNRSSSSSVAVEGRALPPLAAIGPHAKVDPRTGELLFVSVDLQSQPYTVGGVLGPDGYVTHLWPLDLPYPVLMHDMAVTANYLVVLYLPLCFDTKVGQQALAGRGAWSANLTCKHKQQHALRIDWGFKKARRCDAHVCSGS